MKRFSLVAAAALLVAGTQLHAQAAKHDTTAKKVAKHTPAKQAGAAKGDSKAAAKSADTSHKVVSKSAGMAKKEAAMKAAKHDSATKKKP